MAQASNLIDLILRLLKDPAALAEFQQNPDAVLAACGASNVSPEDVHDALVLADDKDDDNHNNNNNNNNKDDNGGHHGHHVPPPPHAEPGESDHDAAVRYIKEYVTNNYVDDRDTNIDNSVNQQIHTDGGDVDQLIHTTSTTASGDGAVAAAGDIDGSQVTTGDDNQIGDGNIRGDGNVQGDHNNAVNGDHNTTAFGSGAANSADIDHASVSGGGALSVGGAGHRRAAQHRRPPGPRDHRHDKGRHRPLVQRSRRVDGRLAQQQRRPLLGRLAQRGRQQRAKRQHAARRAPCLTHGHRGSSLAVMRRPAPPSLGWRGRALWRATERGRP